ncbi:MAG: hypothetical protein M3O00_12395 [Pseudomonadota bacterium]|jgi:hypothetical protein|nr:hypothetical protein [Pseudomonadota bacterium]
MIKECADFPGWARKSGQFKTPPAPAHMVEEQRAGARMLGYLMCLSVLFWAGVGLTVWNVMT